MHIRGLLGWLRGLRSSGLLLSPKCEVQGGWAPPTLRMHSCLAVALDSPRRVNACMVGDHLNLGGEHPCTNRGTYG